MPISYRRQGDPIFVAVRACGPSYTDLVEQRQGGAELPKDLEGEKIKGDNKMKVGQFVLFFASKRILSTEGTKKDKNDDVSRVRTYAD